MVELIPTSWSDLRPYALSILLVGFYLCVAPRLPRRQTWARVLVAGVCLATAVRYLAWRVWATLLPAELASATGAWYLCIYAIEIIAFVNYSIFYLIMLRWAERSGEADQLEAALRRRPAAELPSVDVFIPTYNEGPEVLHRTILAALSIDYPRFQVYVLDDGGRDWLREYCAEKGARYIRRVERTHAKAGNLNHALRLTSAELFAIFDADFAAARNFLYRTVGFFDNPSIGIVQTPQHFFNPDPIQHNLGLARAAGRPAALLRGHGPEPRCMGLRVLLRLVQPPAQVRHRGCRRGAHRLDHRGHPLDHHPFAQGLHHALPE